MAYNVYIICDICGDTTLNFTNVSVSISLMKKLARGRGWGVGNHWVCPHCKKIKAKKEEKEVKLRG